LQRIQFAKSKSDAVAKAEGTFIPKAKRKARDMAEDGEGEGEGAPPSKRVAAAGGGGGGGSAAELVLIPAPPAPTHVAPPSNTLLAQNLPAEVTQEALHKLFSQYAGLREVRLVAARRVAFIEYEREADATPALQGLSNFRLSATHVMQLSYAKS
jgi:U2 small nuclear ribonucleoprotein B''